MKTKIYCPDIECDSCVKVISKALSHTEGVESFSVNKESVDITYEPMVVKDEGLLRLIHEKGFRASLEPFQRKTFRERCRDFVENRHKYHVEYTMLKYSALTLVLLVLIEVMAYVAFFQNMDILAKYSWWTLYIDLAVISIGSAIWHIKSYKANVTSMVGMMVGMTFGMQTGMMIGTILGATNGLFIGGTTAMLLAVGVGFYNGKCCGIMGVMEGMMAGVMGGIMGSMIGTMFRVDHILWFMPIFIAFNMLIMWGLSYMLFEEVIEDNQNVAKKHIDFNTFFSYSVIATATLIVLMIYGPKTGLAGVGGL
ncbi:cation transporter [Candidatus Woesearchaeota archaeon]|nr:cation transporter [Candidatus Woesearchaeota archaeon]